MDTNNKKKIKKNTNNKSNNKISNQNNNQITSDTNNQTKFKNKQNLIKSHYLGGIHYTYLIILIGILMLFVIFIFYERYYEKKVSLKKNNNFEVLLNKEENGNNSYHFKQEFGTLPDGSAAYKNNILVSNLDKYFNIFNDTDSCQDGQIQKGSIYMQI